MDFKKKEAQIEQLNKKLKEDKKSLADAKAAHEKAVQELLAERKNLAADASSANEQGRKLQ